jgi:hypothetical protein
MPIFVWGMVKLYRNIKDDHRLALFFWFAAPITVIFTIASPFLYVKMNWLAPAYLSALPAIVYLFFRSVSGKWRTFGKSAMTFSIILTAVFNIIIFLPGIGFGKPDTIHGWSELAERIDTIKSEMSEQGELFICGYEYKTASQLRFHLDGQPEVYSNNIIGEKGLAYDYWSSPDSLIGQNCIFVYDRRNRFWNQSALQKLFEKLEGPEILTVSRGGKKVTDFYIFKCYKYKG